MMFGHFEDRVLERLCIFDESKERWFDGYFDRCDINLGWLYIHLFIYKFDR